VSTALADEASVPRGTLSPEDRDRIAYRWLLESRDGRHIVNRIRDWSGIDHQSGSTTVEGALVAEGKRSIGLMLKAQLEHYAPDLCVGLERERLQEMSLRAAKAAEDEREKHEIEELEGVAP
jgi:hypothetical protein